MIKTTRDKLDLLAEEIAKLTKDEVELVASETYAAQDVQRQMVNIDMEHF
jgi:glycine/serine hydroxymethyltransferase